MKQLIYLLLLILGSSCANVEVLEAPWNTEPIPVVYSVISPNQSVEVFLKQTYNNDYPNLKSPYPEAKVYMCGADSNWVELNRLNYDSCVFADVLNKQLIESGKTYTLKVVLANKIIRAQTTVPEVKAVINEAVCFINNQSGYVLMNGAYIPASFNYLSVHYTLPEVKNLGYTLSAFENQPIELNDLSGSNYVSTEFPCPEGADTIQLRLNTLDPYLKKYQLSLAISSSMGQPQVSIVDAVMNTFGGVLPQFNNIVNGVGIFGSWVSDVKKVAVTNKTN